MDELFYPLCRDIALLALSIALTFRFLDLFHPLTTYLFFHGYVITYRVWRLYDGAAPSYSGNPNFEAIRVEEYLRGLIYAEISLAAFVLGAILVQRKSTKVVNKHFLYQRFDKSFAKLILGFCLPFGIFLFLSLRSGDSSLSWNTVSGYIAYASMWPACCGCLAIFVFGFRWLILIPFALYLCIVGLQGYHRVMFLLPLLFSAILFIQRSGRKWPNFFETSVCVLIIILFPEAKFIGREFQQTGFSGAVDRAALAFDFTRESERVEDLFDQLSGALTLTDRQGSFYYGTTYLYALTLPIPRFIYPDKPGLAQHISDISTAARPYNLDGRIITLTGDSYLNFGISGVFAIPFLLSCLLTFLYLTASRSPPDSIGRFFQLTILVTLLQVFRDGLSSILLFGVFQNFPMALAMVLHALYRSPGSIASNRTELGFQKVANPDAASQAPNHLVTAAKRQGDHGS